MFALTPVFVSRGRQLARVCLLQALLLVAVLGAPSQATALTPADAVQLSAPIGPQAGEAQANAGNEPVGTAASTATAAHFAGMAMTSKPLRFSASRRLLYQVQSSKFPFLTLEGELLWRNQGQSYSAQLRYSALGRTRLQTSAGTISAAGLSPERFVDRYRSDLAVDFDRINGRINFSGSDSPSLPLQAGAQDRLSFVFQIGAMLAGWPQGSHSGRSISLQVAGPRSAETQIFQVLPLESLDLPGGKLQGMKVERQPTQKDEQKIEVWFSPELDWLPVRIRLTEANGDSADQQWRSIESLAASE